MKKLLLCLLVVLLTFSTTGCIKDMVKEAYSESLFDEFLQSADDTSVDTSSTSTKVSSTPAPAQKPATSKANVSSYPKKESSSSTAPSFTSSSKAAESIQSVDPSSTLLPDLTAFLGKSPAISGKYHGGRRAQFKKLPASHRQTITNELLALLNEDRYQLTQKDYWTSDGGNDHHYDFSYTGTSTVIDEITGKNDDDHPYNVELTIYTKEDSDEFSVQIHYSSAFTVEDPGKRVSVSISGSGSGGSGGSIGGDGIYTPEFSKLDCLTCGGDGDCTRCGGDGYTGTGATRGGCERCHGDGDCRACGGTGKRD